ncbi:MAG: Rne/Rng family ribonuclease [Deltaproteobacteria bacterium]|nr:Rne/Rng family ribonuclease [Deltaproteobacteria bacterium]
MSGKNRIVVNSTPNETRIALLENNRLVELFIERERDKGIVGNIYKGKIMRILPGMEAAFIDIGHDRTAFLHVDDIISPEEQFHSLINGEGEEKFHHYKPRRKNRKRIQDVLKEGDEILVQVTKNPIGSKGARLTCHVSLPGRFIVLMPTVNHTGISRQITDENTRKELKKIIEEVIPPQMGAIVRTVASDQKKKTLKSDIGYLTKSWHAIQKNYSKSQAPSLIHEDLNLILRIVRDRLTGEIDDIYVDSKQVHKEVLNFIKNFNPQLKKIIKLHTLKEHIFDVYGIEKDINRALGKKVWLKSGGYLIIDQTEALTVVDVNTGRYVGKKNLEETILKTNLEAAREIAFQIRLRNCSGIIIVDFIDMEERYNRDKLLDAFEKALSQDKAQTHLLKMTELGLAQMTRKRTRESLIHTLCEPCPYCDGKGFIKNAMTTVLEIWREFKKQAPSHKSQDISIRAHSDIIKFIEEEEKETLAFFSKQFNKNISLNKETEFHREQFEIVGTE